MSRLAWRWRLPHTAGCWRERKSSEHTHGSACWFGFGVKSASLQLFWGGEAHCPVFSHRIRAGCHSGWDFNWDLPFRLSLCELGSWVDVHMPGISVMQFLINLSVWVKQRVELPPDFTCSAVLAQELVGVYLCELKSWHCRDESAD